MSADIERISRLQTLALTVDHMPMTPYCTEGTQTAHNLTGEVCFLHVMFSGAALLEEMGCYRTIGRI